MRYGKMVSLCLGLGVLVSVWGCASIPAPVTGGSGAAALASTAENPAEGSHAERTYRKPEVSLAGYSAVLVAPPEIETTAERNEKIDDFLAQLRGTISVSLVQALEASGKFAEVTGNEDKAKQAGRHLVCRSDVVVHFGSTAARLLIGMGAGRSKLIVVNSLVDPESGEVLLKYTGWGGAIAGYGFQILGKMQADAVAISQYFGGITRTNF